MIYCQAAEAPRDTFGHRLHLHMYMHRELLVHKLGETSQQHTLSSMRSRACVGSILCLVSEDLHTYMY